VQDADTQIAAAKRMFEAIAELSDQLAGPARSSLLAAGPTEVASGASSLPVSASL
jgi:hypothetical protein